MFHLLRAGAKLEPSVAAFSRCSFRHINHNVRSPLGTNVPAHCRLLHKGPKTSNDASTWRSKSPSRKLFAELTLADRKKYFLERYNNRGIKNPALEKISRDLPLVDRLAVFANADTSLMHIHTYGFDYDYTLASYTSEVQSLIYNAAMENLVAQGYPDALMKGQYDPSFAIRGLYYDKQQGFLLKIDQYCKVQSDTVFRGRRQVPLEEVLSAYSGLRLSTDYIETHCHMYKDLFALAEMCLLSDVIQLMSELGLPFAPQYVFSDVRRAVGHVHSSGKMYRAIIDNPDRYLEPNPNLGPYLERLRRHKKQCFMLTNSPYYFVDAGMRFLLGDYLDKTGQKWPELFDVVICDANKPQFYQQGGRQFRSLDTTTGLLSLRPVDKLERGQVYVQGGWEELCRLSGFSISNVLYMGDQVYADLVEPQKLAKWKTAAIVQEVDHEVGVMNSTAFRTHLCQLLEVESLIQIGQVIDSKEIRELVFGLKLERTKHRQSLKELVNPNFGSSFRTSSSRTMFFYTVGRYADVYTSSINNIMQYGLDHVFYAGRLYFPHEVPFPQMSMPLEFDKLYS